MSACDCVFVLVRLVPGIVSYLGPNVQKGVEEEAVRCISCLGRYIRGEGVPQATVDPPTTPSDQSGGTQHESRDSTAVTTVQPGSPDVSFGPVSTGAVFQPVNMDRDPVSVAVSVEVTLSEESCGRGVRVEVVVKRGSVVLILRYPATQISENISRDIEAYVVPRAMQLFYENGVFDKAWLIEWHVETNATAINEFFFQETKKERMNAVHMAMDTTPPNVGFVDNTKVVTQKPPVKFDTTSIHHDFRLAMNVGLGVSNSITLHGNSFALKSFHGTYFTATSGYDRARVDLVDHIDDGAVWTFLHIHDNVYGLRSFYGTYLRAYPGGENAAVDLAPHLREHEHWTVVSPSPGKFAFRSAHKNYLRARKDLGRADQHKDVRDWNMMTWEQFELVPIKRI